MDYTKGAIDLDKRAMVRMAIDKLGPQSPCPNGALFSDRHLESLLYDGDFYGLNGEADNLAQRFVEDTVIARPWRKKTKDCDNRTNQAVGDLNKKSDELEWGANSANLPFIYVSKTLGDQSKEWGGYHAAILHYRWMPSKGDFDLWICEPKILRLRGDDTPERWMRPEEEMKRWTHFSGR